MPQAGFARRGSKMKRVPRGRRPMGRKAAVSHRGKALAVFEEKLKAYLAQQK